MYWIKILTLTVKPLGVITNLTMGGPKINHDHSISKNDQSLSESGYLICFKVKGKKTRKEFKQCCVSKKDNGSTFLM